MKINKIAVLGDGGWGTTLAVLLAKKGFAVTLWGAFPDYLRQVEKRRLNTKFLPGIRIPGSVKFQAELRPALSGADIVVLAVPSQYLRSVLKKVQRSWVETETVWVSVTKGIEISSLRRMSEVIHELLGTVHLGVLSGPTIAHEVAGDIPTAAVVASSSSRVRSMLQDVFMNDRFRIYTSADVVGVELGGSLKNVIAIACGISDGLGFGTNTKAALLSRGLAEMARLGHAMGAQVKTFSGISGLGDLVTTCFSPYSRNRYFGEQIGKGKTMEQVAKHMLMVAEGVPTARSAYRLSRRDKVDAPIIEQVYSVLYSHKPAQTAVRDLMTRQKRQE